MSSNTVKFAMLNANHGGFSFTSYHNEDGNEVYYQTGVDKYQRPITKRVHFPSGVRVISIKKTVKDNTGRLLVDFIRNSPFCRQSSIAGARPTFTEIDIEKDASDSNEDKKFKFVAQGVVFDADDESLKNLSILFGYDGDNKDLQVQCLLNQAEINPKALIDASESKDTECRALIRDLIKRKILTVNGTMIEFKVSGTKGEPILVGIDENAAVGKLMTDDKIKRSLLNQIKIQDKTA